MENNKVRNSIFAVIFIVLVAGLGSVFVMLGMDWFNATTKPSEWIPNFVIPVVWSVIYLSFAVIFVLLISQSKLTKKLVILGIINGALNVLWCLIFFAFNLTFLGNIFIVVNTIFGYLLWIELNKTNKVYSYILSLYPI
ncbi:MAG: tryptophan-rich sensory protein, partial [Clostridiales bacterium]|nr:tryptophan-rich sensory protein [Candidatus Apopatousia equi]